MRINKYIASRGIVSRRKADEWIKEGRVSVNGQIIHQPGLDINEKLDLVEVDGQGVIEKLPPRIYIKLNKPPHILSSASDDRGRKTVVDLVEVEERIFPVGRLDYDSQGLILLTNDGELTQRLLHPRHHLEKIYEIKVKGILGSKEVQAFEEGVEIDGYRTQRADLKLQRTDRMAGISLARVHLWEGRNRQIRKMMEVLGMRVLQLKRLTIGPISLGDLKEGEWAYLTQAELQACRALLDEKEK